MESSIIIFRFHNHFSVCKSRLKMLQFHNPDIPVYGIYGGKNQDFRKCRKKLGKYFKHLWIIPEWLSETKWSNFETILKVWYVHIGKDIDFDRAYVIEWDLLLLDSLKNIYQNIGVNEVGVTGLMPVDKIKDNWYWSTDKNQKRKLEYVFSLARQYYGHNSVFYASLGPGLCFPKSYLDNFSKLNMPAICHEEIYFPLFAQLLNYPLKDTEFFNGWFNDKEKRYFNCDKNYVSKKTIRSELLLRGRKVFHPYQKQYFHINPIEKALFTIYRKIKAIKFYKKQRFFQP